ncbi:o-succinylbenzoate synthase [Synechococcus sp. RSCCF101]|uniref:o-succinylbenzoate synthase n=1 Tax=Synechococcus sp. RSCCF101 TaxID=2511069 RepID=UPI0012442C26|nr:o-succinylbenzoate synthase [Synechococcus sp. RSCCF101]QEY33515.1 o-succinylbenzoate synthase [Synechococcus sp. RSCCF101]
MRTAGGVWAQRRGWLLRVASGDGRLGWGEAGWLLEAGAPLPLAPPGDGRCSREALDRWLAGREGPLAFALGAALAELDGEDLSAPAPERAGPVAASAALLPAGEAMLPALQEWLETLPAVDVFPWPPTVKWKVAAGSDNQERRLLERLLACLPAQARLRLDANGGWDRSTAHAWADRLMEEPRLQWLEQPLPAGDLAGLEALDRVLPVALDESLQASPGLRSRWRGWQVRRPAREGDPRPLLQALRGGAPRLMLSTDLETGIGRRWLLHLARRQAEGPTPAAPGLAPGWTPDGGGLFDVDPAGVWRAAGPPSGAGQAPAGEAKT